MLIDKLATRAAPFLRRSGHYPSARAAFRAFLQAAAPGPDDRVLLPAFIGWSAREGSGVFDPVRELGLNAAFYRTDERLEIDLADLEACLRAHRVRVFVVIHYFGRVDPSYRAAVKMARDHGALVLEDEAHAMLSDLVGGVCGRLGDACIYSLHKMLPVPSGGMLVLSPGVEGMDALVEGAGPSPWEFDLAAMAERRVRNTAALYDLLPSLADEVEPLWPVPETGTVLQTFPVVVRRASRDALYFAMNDAGFGVVSLYHTLIDDLPRDRFPASHHLARRILNLPVHPDAGPEAMAAMVQTLGSLVRAAPAAEGGR